MKHALISIVSMVTLLLVGSCGLSAVSAPTSNSDPSFVLKDSFSWQGNLIEVLCRKGHMYVVSDVYYGANVQRIDNHEECK